jgi:hypothetical protein
MPFTTSELSDAQKTSLDYFLRNKPVDQINVERPLLKALQAKQKEFPGGKQYVTEQLRKANQSNFQWINGAQEVTYNRRQSIEQSQFAWRTAHDGYAIDEDRLAQNGITMIDDKQGGKATRAELVQLNDLLVEQNEILALGFDEKFSAALHLDGTSSSDAITGLDALVSLTPSSGTVGGIDASSSSNTWWRNSAATSLSSSTLLANMEGVWRSCTKNGGMPDFIEAGSAFIDAYIAAMVAAGQQIQYAGGQARKLDGGVSGVYFKGVEIIWNPEFEDNFGESPSTSWSKRCYFLNTRHLTLRPMAGQDRITRKPPRAYNKYEYYCAITWRGALTTNRRNAHGVLALS